MARSTQRLWRAGSPLGWTSELGLVGTGPVAVLAGFTLAAAVGLIQPDRSWAQDAALILFCIAVAVFVIDLRLIIAAQFHFAVPSDYLTQCHLA
jgi:O-antigen ligase